MWAYLILPSSALTSHYPLLKKSKKSFHDVIPRLCVLPYSRKSCLVHCSIGRLVWTQFILWVTDYLSQFLFPHGQLGVSLRVNKSMGHSAGIRVFTLCNTLHAVLCTHLYFKSLHNYTVKTPIAYLCRSYLWGHSAPFCLDPRSNQQRSASVDLLNWRGYRVCCRLLQTGATSPQLLFSGVRKSCNSKWTEFRTMECDWFYPDHLS